MRSLIDIVDFSVEEVDELLHTACDIIEHPEKYAEACHGKKLATLFFEPSTRTRLSFEAAMLELGGSVLGFSEANSSSSAKGESVADTAKVLSCYADIMAMRHPKEGAPYVVMVVGVNGAGKTTTIGKLAAQLTRAGKKVYIGAADTFRAAAIDQLAVWCERSGADIVKQNEGSDPAAVVFDAIAYAKRKQADVLIIDTAGRLHNKKNLMNELAKINRVISRELPDAARETLLVLDATTGQNAVNQAKEFMNVAELTGIALTKLDGTARGGVVLTIKNELKLPVKFIGVGEQIDDLQPFRPKVFAKALFEDTSTNFEDEE